MGIAFAVARIFDLIIFILFVTIVLSWFPQVKWEKQPFYFMKEFSEIFLGPFRKIIPPIGMVDISPVVAFFAIWVLRNIIIRILYSLGL